MRWSQSQLEDYLARQKKRSSASVQVPPAEKQAERPHLVRAREYACSSPLPPPVKGWTGKQTETEKRYNREILLGTGRFESVTLILPGGGRYTPDFMTIDGGVVTFHEVKGSYRLGSQGRAHTAFQEALVAFPMWRFVWAHWTGKEWSCKTFEPSAMVRQECDG